MYYFSGEFGYSAIFIVHISVGFTCFWCFTRADSFRIFHGSIHWGFSFSFQHVGLVLERSMKLFMVRSTTAPSLLATTQTRWYKHEKVAAFWSAAYFPSQKTAKLSETRRISEIPERLTVRLRVNLRLRNVARRVRIKWAMASLFAEAGRQAPAAKPRLCTKALSYSLERMSSECLQPVVVCTDCTGIKLALRGRGGVGMPVL